MEPEVRTGVAQVATCTTAAAHRRDHHHDDGADCCHPHAVEVVHLGSRAITVCHDCAADSGFIPHLEAEALAEGHRQRTRTDSAPLVDTAAA